MQASTGFCSPPQPRPGHESIFKIDGCFDACVAGAQSAMALGIRLTLNFVTTPQNIDHHVAYVELCTEPLIEAVDQISSSAVTPPSLSA